MFRGHTVTGRVVCSYAEKKALAMPTAASFVDYETLATAAKGQVKMTAIKAIGFTSEGEVHAAW
jgi:hypothetical protein